MSRVRLIMLALVAVLAMSAVAASAASAFTEFTAAEGAKLKSKQKGNQTLEAKAGKATVGTICTEVAGEGTVKGKKTEVEGVPAYKGCTTGGLASVVSNKCAFDIHIGGTVDVLGKSCATITVTSTKCVITITGEQKGLKEALFENKEKELVTTGKVSGANFTVAEKGKARGFEAEKVEGTASYNGASLTAGTEVK